MIRLHEVVQILIIVCMYVDVISDVTFIQWLHTENNSQKWRMDKGLQFLNPVFHVAISESTVVLSV